MFAVARTSRPRTVTAGDRQKLGYTDVRLYPDGIEDWVTAGLPVESA